MSPLKALYGYEATTFADQIFGDSRAPKEKDWIQESQYILKVIKENLQTTPSLQKIYDDKNKKDHSFQVGELVYLRLQPYNQSSLKGNRHKK